MLKGARRRCGVAKAKIYRHKPSRKYAVLAAGKRLLLLSAYAFAAALVCFYVAAWQDLLAASVTALFFLAGLLYLWRRLQGEAKAARGKRRAGSGGEAKALEIVRNLREARYVCANFEFQSDGSRCETDLLVVTEAGLFNIEVKYLAGMVRGDADAPRWLQDGTRPVRNPLLQVRRSSRILRRFVRQAGFGVVDVYSLVYFGHPRGRIAIDGDHSGVFVCFSAEALRDFIRAQRAVYACGDLDTLVKCLRKAQ